MGLEKHTIRLREGDFKKIEDHFKLMGESTNEVIRRLVASFVDRIEAKELAQLEANKDLPDMDIDV